LSSVAKNLSSHEGTGVPDAGDFCFGIVYSEWNSAITLSLKRAAEKTLIRYGASKKNIIVRPVPGSYELPLAAQFMAESTSVDAIICLGCVIQGETRHFDFICSAVSDGIMQLNLKFGIPFVFGVLTTQDMKHAKDRAGGKHGNKGVEAAITAIKMAALKKSF
jgi:6,7-dimethyl-8-ribityllumazine synthase